MNHTPDVQFCGKGNTVTATPLTQRALEWINVNIGTEVLNRFGCITVDAALSQPFKRSLNAVGLVCR